jgi:hypothetical protein
MLTPGTIFISLVVLTLSWAVQGGYVRLLAYALRKLLPLGTRLERVSPWLRNNALSLLCLNLVPWSLWMLLPRPLFLRVLDVLGTVTTFLGLLVALFGSLKLELGPVPSALLRWTRLLDRRAHRFLFHRGLLFASGLSRTLRKAPVILLASTFGVMLAARLLTVLFPHSISDRLMDTFFEFSPSILLLAACAIFSGLILSWMARRLLLISRLQEGSIFAFSICGLIIFPFLAHALQLYVESFWYPAAFLIAPLLGLYSLVFYLAFRRWSEVVWSLAENASSAIQKTGFLASVAGGVLLAWSKLA